MQKYKEYFKGKKVTMMGLGLLGRGLNDAKFLAECGVDLLITDLKKAEDLAPALKKLAKYKNIKYVLGEHRLEDFKDRDFVLKAAGVPLDSPYIAEARKNNIPVEMDEALFTKLAPEVKVIGVTGTRGKTTTTYLIYKILKLAFGQKVFLGGNIKGLATLPLLKKVNEHNRPGYQNNHPSLQNQYTSRFPNTEYSKSCNLGPNPNLTLTKAGISGKPSAAIVVMELSSWQLQGFGEAKISPQISVFTNLMNDHLNYYKGSMDLYFSDKAKICDNQKKEDFIICGQKIASKIKSCGKKIIAKISDVPKGWKLKVKGEHNLENIACAIAVARILRVDEKIIKKAVENFNGVEGRQEFVKEYKGIKIYNDTTATTPDATIVALKSLSDKKRKNIVLIMGGADKNLDMSGLVKETPKYCKAVFLLAGSGSEKLSAVSYSLEAKDYIKVDNLKDAVNKALGVSKKGDILLFSPAFASFGMFKNEFDRGDKFNKLINGLK